MKIFISAGLEGEGAASLGYHAGAGAEGPVSFRGYLARLPGPRALPVQLNRANAGDSGQATLFPFAQ
jgi:hypothetical protein